MSEHAGEKTEQPTPRKLEDALKQGQVARSPEVQTVFVLGAGLAALFMTGGELWRQLAGLIAHSLGHLHDVSLSPFELQGYAVSGALWVGRYVGPVVLTIVLAALCAGAIQNRFNTASEALGLKWERIDPMAGFQRLFSSRAAVPALLSFLKLALVALLSWSSIRNVFNDPIFFSAISLSRIATFLGEAALTIATRIVLVLGALAALDYLYQWWRTRQDLMMTKEEVKEEMKNSEGNPQVKSAMRRRRRSVNQRKMLADVPKADVVLVNPTHIAVALKYDRRTMKAPKIVAKGIRLNALRIREMAEQHQVPIVENKPLARLMFKHGKVGGEIPAQLYVAVAEVLAWVYRTNRYRYYAQENQA